MSKQCSICSKKVIAKGLCDRHYRKTKDAFLTKAYKNMSQRVRGVQNNNSHIYFGLDILLRQEFIDWSKKDVEFNRLFEIWERNEYDRTLTPSVDRIDSELGYTKDNIRWITNSENCSLGRLSHKRSVYL